MPYDQNLAGRVSRAFEQKGATFETKSMMGGLCFMVDGKMCAGITGDLLMARIDPAEEAAALKRTGCKPMDFTGRPMKGFVFIEPTGTRTAAQLAAWLNLALEFNPKAKASKKRAGKLKKSAGDPP
ncbi:MAG TPA: TfoX/Sxy family protein [Chthoniobacterales bacterium]